jgi:raffinose/stachyose/melibiose transport system substrate-binding protein
MLSKIRTVSALLIVLAAISACNRGGQSGSTFVDNKDLRVLYYNDLTSPNSAAAQAWTFDTFRDRNPDVNVYLETLYNEPFHQKTAAYAASGQVPDVLYVWPSGRSTALHDRKLLKDLSALIQKDGLRNSFLPIAFDPAQQAGAYVAMITQGTTASHTFYTNMEVLNAAGLQPARTYAELVAQVPVLRAKGFETIIMPNQDTWVMQSCLFSMVAGRFCGEGWEKRILNGEAKFTDADFVAALDFIRRLYADGVLLPSSIGLGYGEGPGAFATNRGAYMVDGDWRVGAFLTDRDTGRALISLDRQRNIGIGVFPDIEGAKINSSTSGILGTGWAMSATIPAGSLREDAAWRLIKWLTGVENMTRMVQDGGLPAPSRTDIDFGTLNLEPMQVAMANMATQYSTTTVVIDGAFHADVFTPINDGLQEIGLGAKTPQQVANEAQQAFDRGRARGDF